MDHWLFVGIRLGHSREPVGTLTDALPDDGRETYTVMSKNGVPVRRSCEYTTDKSEE